MAFVLQLKREFLVLVLSETFSVLFVHGWPVCPRELNSLGRKNLHDMRLPNHYWSQPITFNRHCVCTLFPTLWAFQGAEELFNTHLTDSKTWTESSLCVAFLAQPPTVPCATLQQPLGTMAGFCRSSGSSTLLEHPPGRTQQPCGGVREWLRDQLGAPPGARHWGHAVFGTHTWQRSAAANPLCQLLYRSEQGCCHVPAGGDSRMTHEKHPDSLQFSVCDIK